MKDLSVSYFKAKISACLREVQAGETIVITEHQRPVAEVRPYDQSGSLIVRSEKPFSLAGSEPTTPSARVWEALLDEERGEP
jgi:prevent-host-death family protein